MNAAEQALYDELQVLVGELDAPEGDSVRTRERTGEALKRFCELCPDKTDWLVGQIYELLPEDGKRAFVADLGANC